MKNIKIILTISFLLLLISCGKMPFQEMGVKNIKNKERIILRKLPQQKNVYGIKIKGNGYIDGEAKISLTLNQKEYKTERLKGDFNFKWGGDWYADTAEVIYQPISVQGGKVTLNYCFLD